MPSIRTAVFFVSACASAGFLVMVLTGSHLDPFGWACLGISFGLALGTSPAVS